MTRNNYPILTTALVFFSLVMHVTAIFGEGPVISFHQEATSVRLIQKADLGGDVNKQFVITATGTDGVSEVYGNVTGVLLQATANSDGTLQSLPIELSYRLNGDHNAALQIAIGDRHATSNVPAWIWAIAALYADHDATAAITMTDDPPTATEKRFRQRWIASAHSQQRLLWVRYHPTVDDTAIGFFLFSADAMLAGAQHVRTITNGLRGFEQYSGYSVTMDPGKSGRAARTLDGLIALKSQPGDCVMFNDVNADFVFNIENGDLAITGSPSYHFARKYDADDFREVSELTTLFHKNRHLMVEVNPLVNRVVADFAKLVAFFNYVDRTAPDELDQFISRLQPVLDRIPTIRTPNGIVVRSR